jgi:hypothetical protein
LPGRGRPGRRPPARADYSRSAWSRTATACSTSRRHGDLQIVEDLSAHRRIWRAQKIGRALGVVILILGLAGLFVARPLSKGTVSDGANSIEYDRIGAVWRRFVS